MQTENPTFATPATRPAGPSARDRILGAVAYLGPLCLIPTVMGPKNPWLRWHAAQGFVVFFLECVALALAVVVDATLGRIPWVGLLVMLILRVGLVAGFVVISAIGLVKAIAGERAELPIVGRYARLLPRGPRA